MIIDVKRKNWKGQNTSTFYESLLKLYNFLLHNSGFKFYSDNRDFTNYTVMYYEWSVNSLNINNNQIVLHINLLYNESPAR